MAWISKHFQCISKSVQRDPASHADETDSNAHMDVKNLYAIVMACCQSSRRKKKEKKESKSCNKQRGNEQNDCLMSPWSNHVEFLFRNDPLGFPTAQARRGTGPVHSLFWCLSPLAPFRNDSPTCRQGPRWLVHCCCL